jgi:hypothetical protein
METVNIDPLAGLPPELPENVARDHAAALVKGGGVTLEAANTALATRNAALLAANSRDLAEANRAGLLNDDNFRAKYLAGDPDAVSRLLQADLRVAQANGKLTDRNAAPADYSLNVASHMPDAKPEAAQQYSEDFAKLAAGLNLPQANAQHLVDQHFAATRETATMDKAEASLWGQRQTSMLHGVIGADAEAKLRQASDTLSKTSGRKLDLAAIVTSNGADVALTLYHQAQALAARK